ncbi:ribosome-inactivating family protein [Streptomyces sp. NPDC001339]|uniref:ribosome-inactivating family protein n=1 Tax=Streptomyces sp. NPDC001339 TaxID=3364563 RepID=UPI0036BB7598
MALEHDDILDNALDFSEESASGPGQFKKTIDFLRGRYGTYTPQQTGDRRFFMIDVILSDGRSVQLYFLKRNLYGRGYTIDHGNKYMAAWDKDEAKKSDAEKDRLIPTGLAHMKKYFLPAEYDSTADQDWLSGDTLDSKLGLLHTYLTAVSGGKPADLKKAKTALYAVARMTAEMARFGLFATELLANWEVGIGQDHTVTIKLDYGSGAKKDYTTPAFKAVVLEWRAVTNTEAGKGAPLQLGGKAMAKVEAAAILADGARWRQA